MKQEQSAILDMLIRNKITVEEADMLLDALHDSYRSERNAARTRKPVPDTAVSPISEASPGLGPI